MHTIVALNECADELAASAQQDEDAPICSFRSWENHHCVYYCRSGEDDHIVRVEAGELCPHFIELRSKALYQKQTRTTGKLAAAGVGRQLMHPVLWSKGPFSVADGVAKTMLQCITNTYHSVTF